MPRSTADARSRAEPPAGAAGAVRMGRSHPAMENERQGYQQKPYAGGFKRPCNTEEKNGVTGNRQTDAVRGKSSSPREAKRMAMALRQNRPSPIVIRHQPASKRIVIPC